MAEHFDVIIIGTGAGGGTLAHALAGSGKRILLLERGDFLPREMENWDPRPVFVDGRYISKDTWFDGDGKPFQPQVHYFVGGATKLYGAALYRLRPGISGNCGTSMEHPRPGRCPMTTSSPGTAGPSSCTRCTATVVRTPPRATAASPTPGPPSPTSPGSPRSPRAWRRAATTRSTRRAGSCWMRPNRARSTCIRCTWCDGYPCLVHAKSDAEVIAVRPVLDRGNVTLLTGAEVTRLQTDPAGRTVTGVVVSRDGGAVRCTPGTSWPVCAGAANSAKLLLNSASDAHPHGLANGSDQVGRNYMFHNCLAVVALSKEKNDTVFQKTLGINDFYFATKDYEYPAGNIQMIGKSNAEAMRGEKPKLTKLSPEWTLSDVAGHAVDFWLTTEDLPVPENRVTIDGDGNVHLAYQPTNDAEADRLYEELKKILNHTGMAEHHVLGKNFYMDMSIPVAGCAHQAGTCRFGTDPATSVLDINCKAHELDNLYVVDTSFFPSIGAVNPALTAMANALRVADHIQQRLTA